MKNMLAQIIREEDGQGMVEYGLIIAGVALAVIATLFLLGPKISDMFKEINEKVTPPTPTTPA